MSAVTYANHQYQAAIKNSNSNETISASSIRIKQQNSDDIHT